MGYFIKLGIKGRNNSDYYGGYNYEKRTSPL